jgi:hypothetical protein
VRLPRWISWKWLGLAGLAGVAATGVVVARSERKRRAYTPDDVRARLRARAGESANTHRDTSASTEPPSEHDAERSGMISSG